MLKVVYDADCGVCQASVDWLKRRGTFEFIGNDQPLPEGVTQDETEHTVVVLDGARKYVRADAVARVLREVPRWRVAATFLKATRPLANLGYDAFAKRRHKVSAALGLRACSISEAPARKQAAAQPGVASDTR